MADGGNGGMSGCVFKNGLHSCPSRVTLETGIAEARGMAQVAQRDAMAAVSAVNKAVDALDAARKSYLSEMTQQSINTQRIVSELVLAVADLKKVVEGLKKQPKKRRIARLAKH